MYIPVRKELREGQHMGVETNELLKWTPWSRIMRKVFGMTSIEPAMFQTSMVIDKFRVYGSSKDTST